MRVDWFCLLLFFFFAFQSGSAVCGLQTNLLSLHHGNTESRKNLLTKIHLSTRYTLSTRNQWTPLVPLIYSQIHVTIFPLMAKLLNTPIKLTKTHNSFILSDKGVTLEMSGFQIFHSGNSTWTNSLKPNFHVSLSHRHNTTVSLETRNVFTIIHIMLQRY